MRKVLTYAMLFLILCTVFCSCSNDEKISDATEADNNILESELLLSRPLKSPFLRDIVQTQYLAYFLKHAPKSFHGSFEVIGRCRQKHVHSISRHTLIKVAAQPVI